MYTSLSLSLSLSLSVGVCTSRSLSLSLSRALSLSLSLSLQQVIGVSTLLMGISGVMRTYHKYSMVSLPPPPFPFFTIKQAHAGACHMHLREGGGGREREGERERHRQGERGARERGRESAGERARDGESVSGLMRCVQGVPMGL
jgi:hypothetical protein